MKRKYYQVMPRNFYNEFWLAYVETEEDEKALNGWYEVAERDESYKVYRVTRAEALSLATRWGTTITPAEERYPEECNRASGREWYKRNGRIWERI